MNVCRLEQPRCRHRQGRWDLVSERSQMGVVAYRGPAIPSRRADPVLEWKILCSHSKPVLVGRIVQGDQAARRGWVLGGRCWQMVERWAEWMGRRMAQWGEGNERRRVGPRRPFRGQAAVAVWVDFVYKLARHRSRKQSRRERRRW